MILVAIGSNLAGADGASPRETCLWAMERLASLPQVHLDAASRLYRSDPFPPSAQPDYVNAAVRLRGAVEPEAFLGALHAIEAEAGRRRGVANAARTLDLDLLGIGGRVIDSARLVLPHPRLHLRRFVLLPLADVAPEWVHPVLGRTAGALLADLPPDGTCPLERPGAEILAVRRPSS